MVAEEVVSNNRDFFRVINVRPATICGISPRMRFDVAVNLLTYQALSKGRINVLGGDQVRPNIHILDMVRVYLHLLDDPTIQSGAYNAGFENISIMDIANLITKQISSEVDVSFSNDPRSYRQDSAKLLSTGFFPKFSVVDAISEIKREFELGKLTNSIMNRTVDRMLELKLGESRNG